MWFYFKVIYCTSAVESYGNLTKSLDEGATLSMDFQKVFDKVPHRCLIAKLKHYSISIWA